MSERLPLFHAIGDAHISETIWTKRTQVQGDAYLAFTRAIDASLTYRVPVILLGDVLDVVNPTSNDVQFVRQQISRLEKAGVPVYYLQGNHDKRPKPWLWAVHDYPQYIGDGHEFVIDGLKIRGFDYAAHDQIQTHIGSLTKADTPDILLLHQAAKQALNFEGAWNFDLDWVPEGVRLTVMADIHTPWSGKTAGGRAHYTNALHPRADAEFGQKSTLLVYDDLSVERIPIPGRYFAKIGITSNPDRTVQEVIDAIMGDELAGHKHPLPPVVISTTLDGLEQITARTRLKEVIEKFGGFLFDTVAKTEEELKWSDGKSTELPSPEILLSRMLNKQDHPQVFRLVLDVLQSRTPPLEVVASARLHFEETHPV